MGLQAIEWSHATELESVTLAGDAYNYKWLIIHCSTYSQQALMSVSGGHIKRTRVYYHVTS